MQNEKIKILLIVDDPAETGLIMEMLVQQRTQEYAVEHVESLADALALLEKHFFDCILVDLGRPDQGLDTALAVRKQAKLTPVAIITIFDDEESALKALEMDIQDYLVKGDITDSALARSIRYAIQRKHITEKLRESEERFTSFMLHMPVAAWMKDMEGRYVYANTEAERIFSMPLEALQGKTDRDIFPEEIARRLADNDRRAFSEGGRLQTTEVLRQADGIEHHSIVNKFLINTSNDNPRFIAGVALDITELMQAENALRESEKKFSRIFDTVPVGITISDLADGRFVEINREGERLSGYRRDEVIGHTSLEFDIWHDPAERARMIDEVLKEGAVRDWEMTFHTKEGKLLQGFFSAVVIEIAGKKNLLSMVSDITERKQAEEALRRNEARLRRFYDSGMLGVFYWNMAGRVIDANDKFLQMIGYTREDLLSGNIDWVNMTPPEYRHLNEQSLEELKATGVNKVPWEKVYRRKDGGLMPVIIAGAMLDEERFNGVAFVLDITERKQLERELEAHSVELEETNKELRTFNYSVAHDLRQPLNTINSYCQAIKMLCGDRLNEECTDYLQKTYDGTMRMNQLIETLLDFSRMAHVELHREMVDLSTVAQELTAGLRVTNPGRRVTFRIADGVTVYGDPNLLRAALDNLIGNAWKYTGLREEAIIEFGSAKIDGTTAYFVRDNGPGFDMADAKMLFQPFKRLPGAEETKGVGIGLATVERIIRRHCGRIWAEGAPDKGATFWFTLPAKEKGGTGWQ